ELREKAAGEGQHARTPGIVADLALGLRYLLAFARSAAVIDEKEREALWERGWTALIESAAAQSAHIAAADPAGLFLRLLTAALASGRAHLADPHGEAPADALLWGWRVKTIGTGENAVDEAQAQGRRIGWTDGKLIYLEPEAAYAEACELSRQQGDGFPILSRTLWRRLKERGHLAACDDARQRNTIRRMLGGLQREVIALRTDLLSCSEPSKPSIDSGETEKAGDFDGQSDGQSGCWSEGPSMRPSSENGTFHAA